jgi:hypothetical protein
MGPRSGRTAPQSLSMKGDIQSAALSSRAESTVFRRTLRCATTLSPLAANPYFTIDLDFDLQASAAWATVNPLYAQYRIRSWELVYEPPVRYLSVTSLATMPVTIGPGVAVYSVTQSLPGSLFPSIINDRNAKCFSPTDPFTLSGKVMSFLGGQAGGPAWGNTQSVNTAAWGKIYLAGLLVVNSALGIYNRGGYVLSLDLEFREPTFI